MENLWSPLAVRRCSRSLSIKKTGRSSAGQRYKCWIFFFDIREMVFLTCVFGAGVLPAMGGSAQRWNQWLRWTQSAYRTDCPGILPGTVSTPQTAERGWNGQTGPACHFWITRGQRKNSENTSPLCHLCICIVHLFVLAPSRLACRKCSKRTVAASSVIHNNTNLANSSFDWR